MKIRNGFVSNSSSSSFICEVCGADESGYDCSLSDVDMCMCENEHIFCIDHAINKDESSDNFNSFEDALEKERDYIPSIYCPICNFEIIPKDISFKYIVKKYNINLDEIASEIKNSFSSYSKFVKYIKEE